MDDPVHVCAWGLIALFAAITAGEVLSVFSNIVQGLLIVVLAITGLLSLNTMLNSERVVNSADEWVDFLENNVDDNACLIIDDPAEHIIVYRFYLNNAKFISTESLSKQDVKEGLNAFLKDGKGRQIWYVINGRQQKIGVESMQSYLEELGYTIESVGFYIIEQKDLEIFKVEEKRHEE